MTWTRTLCFGVWRLVVEDNGFMAEVSGTPPVPRPLASLLSTYGQGEFPGLRELIDAWKEGARGGVGFSPPDPAEGDDLSLLEPRWTELTGEAPGDDTVVISSSFERPSAYIPREALLQILDAIDDCRAQLRPLEPLVHPLEPLEVAATYALARVPISEAEVSSLLAKLDQAGFLDPARADEMLAELHDDLPGLRSYVEAARELHAYYQSSERAQYVRPLDTPPIIGGPVSVEWFRGRAPVPDDDTHPWVWTAFYEAQFRASSIRREGARERFVKVGGRWSRLRWRWEADDAPSLIGAEEGCP